MANRASALVAAGLLLGTTGCPEPPPAPRSATADLVAPSAENPPPPPRPPAPTPPSGLGALRQPAPQKLASQPPSLYEVGAFPPRVVELRPGPEDDRSLVEVYCVGCHSTAYIAMQPPLPRKSWEAEVQKMRGTYGAVIPDPAAVRIVTYLSSYYSDGR